jgi:hypothetical protein
MRPSSRSGPAVGVRDLIGDLVEKGGPARRQRQHRTAVGQLNGQGPADAAGGSGEQDPSTCQSGLVGVAPDVGHSGARCSRRGHRGLLEGDGGRRWAI